MLEGLLNIHDPKYNNASITIKTTNEIYDINIQGYENIGKIFNGDHVEYINNKCVLKKSNIKNKKIVCVLNLFSKYKFKRNKRGIERFKASPIEKHYPDFLVAANIKRKYKKNVLVIIKYLDWSDSCPYGQLIDVLGEVNNINALYQGVLYKYELTNKPIKLDKAIINTLTLNEFYINKDGYNDISSDFIISIDPLNTLDIDDAFSFYELENNKYKIGIHISDVIGTIRDLDLQTILTPNLSTSIYAPHKIVNMLPPILSQNILSLLPNKKRKSITLWITILNNRIISTKIEKTIIINKKSFSYDEFEKKHINNENSRFYKMIHIIKCLDYKNLLEKYKNTFDSHRLIEKLMIIYNCEACTFIKKHNENPIYRIHKKIERPIQQSILMDNCLKDFLGIIYSKSAEYSFDSNNTLHESLEIDDYIHFTSPIRRYVDCYHHSLIHKIVSNTSLEKKISIDIEYINKINKSIKKSNRMFSSIILGNHIKEQNQTMFKGYIYDLSEFKVSIYLPNEKISIYKNLFHKSIQTIYNVYIEHNHVIIINTQTNKINKIQMYTLIDICIYNVVDKNPYKNIVIDLRLDL